MAPDFARFEREYKDHLEIVSIDVEDRAMMKRYLRFKQGQATPETVLMKNGQVVSSQTGSMTLEELELAALQASRK